jgi:hypothetical protein
MVIVIAFDTRFAGSNPAEDDRYLMAIKIRSMTSFGGEVKPMTQCRKILRHVKDPLKYDRGTDRQNSTAISHPAFHASLVLVSAATRAENSSG